MTKFNSLLVAAFSLLLLSISSVQAQEVKNGLTWYNDVEQAYEVSQKSHKPVFAFFTGSDWCGWCHRLQAKVFDKPGFKQWAKSNVVLLELDFPRHKQLPQKLIDQNNSLQQFFNVQGYPTIWVFNMQKEDGKKMNIAALGSLQYPQAEPGKEEEVFLANANAVLKNKK